jgi:hypothetical protein
MLKDTIFNSTNKGTLRPNAKPYNGTRAYKLGKRHMGVRSLS